MAPRRTYPTDQPGPHRPLTRRHCLELAVSSLNPHQPRRLTLDEPIEIGLIVFALVATLLNNEECSPPRRKARASAASR